MREKTREKRENAAARCHALCCPVLLMVYLLIEAFNLP